MNQIPFDTMAKNHPWTESSERFSELAEEVDPNDIYTKKWIKYRNESKAFKPSVFKTMFVLDFNAGRKLNSAKNYHLTTHQKSPKFKAML